MPCIYDICNPKKNTSRKGYIKIKLQYCPREKHFCSGRQISVVAINRPTADRSLENSAEDNSKCNLVKTLRWLFFDCKVLYIEWNSKYLDFSLRSSRQVNRGVRTCECHLHWQSAQVLRSQPASQSVSLLPYAIKTKLSDPCTPPQLSYYKSFPRYRINLISALVTFMSEQSLLKRFRVSRLS